jgi:c-di-GMP-binding flagellar brake protein YcgR
MEERRRFRRTDAKEKALLHGEETRHEGSLIDISSSGMRIIADSEIKIGSPVRGQFKIMPHSGNFYISGEVVWVKAAKEPHQHKYEIGIKFTKVSTIPIH